MSDLEIISSFVEGAPPGELADVVADIKGLTGDTPQLAAQLHPAFRAYNEAQFTTVKLPGSGKNVTITPYNGLGDGRYFDSETGVSFEFDHGTQQAKDVLTFHAATEHGDLIKSILESLGAYTKEHFPNAAYGVFPAMNDSKIAIVIVASKYSPNNFWSGRWRSHYLFDIASSALTGSVKVDVHYYEDGNTRLLTDKELTVNVPGGSAASIVREIASAEKKYQEELNKGFSELSEGAFKGLRRQLPVTRQKIEWEKVTSYRLGQDIGGGSSRR